MTFFHFINCVALTYSPLIITYRFSGLLDSSAAFWSCLKVGGAYVLTQLIKMMCLATFFPLDDTEDEMNFAMEFVKCSVDVLDYLGLYLVLTKLLGKGERKVLVAAIGWASSDAIATRILPLWVGARGTEFSWKYIQNSFDSNINMVFIFSACAFLWLWSRYDTAPFIVFVLGCLLLFIIYRSLLFNALSNVIGAWTVLLLQALVAIATGIGATVLHS